MYGKSFLKRRAKPAPTPDASEMPFIDHLEALRWHILKGLGGILVAVIASIFFAQALVDHVLMAPRSADFITYRLFGMEIVDFKLQNRTITGQFMAYMGTVMFAGFVLGSPVLIYQFWKFVEPGLYPEERQGMRFAAVGATLFFMLGIAFGYYVITPLSLQFFAQFELSPGIENEFDVTRYFSMIVTWSLGIGILFELPVVIYFLAKIGMVTSTGLRNTRKFVLIGVLIVAAFLTPPDPFSQVLVAIPMMVLYEMSIWLTGWVERARAKQRAREEAEEAARLKAEAAATPS